MPNFPNTSRPQSNFLRALRASGTPGPELWPSPAVFRKWLRHPGFLRALESVRVAIFFQSDWDLATLTKFATSRFAAAARASAPHPQSAESLAPPPTTPADDSHVPDESLSLKRLESLLRIAHARQRFLSIDSRHTAVQSLTAQLAAAQSEVATLRDRLADAEQKLLLCVPLDPYIGDDSVDDQPQPESQLSGRTKGDANVTRDLYMA